MTTGPHCPCGGISLADTEDWAFPLCVQCWSMLGQPAREPQWNPLRERGWITITPELGEAATRAAALRGAAANRLEAVLESVFTVEGDPSQGYEVWLHWEGHPHCCAGARRAREGRAQRDRTTLINGLTDALVEAGVTVQAPSGDAGEVP